MSNQKSIIKVIGVGGGGSNAVNYMYNRGIKDVEFSICNTDLQALELSPVPVKIQLGAKLTEGLGAGANPEVGREAALETREEIKELLGHGTKMLFITAGMGGGTGTGAAPVIAEIARELGVLTVAIVTAPFGFEGPRKKKHADTGLNTLREICDTVLVISNDKLMEIYGNLKMSEAFAQADNILTTAAKGIAEMITVPHIVNVDFEDVKTVMRNSGAAVMGSGKAEGENRAIRAAQEALNSPLLNNKNIFGAQKILLSIMSGEKAEIQMDEFQNITEYIHDKVGETDVFIFGTGTDNTLGEAIRVTIIATGFKDDELEAEKKTATQPIPKKEPAPTQDNTVVFNMNNKPANTQVYNVEEQQPEQKPFIPERKTPDKIVYDINDDVNIGKNNPYPKTDFDWKHEQIAKQADERIEKLKKLSQNIAEAESFKEKIEIPAYLRRNIKLDDSNNSNLLS
ncbi:MAG: cell division protein FtsZ [Bacteroidetes bacterium]|nr:MAG: cell division protein FtsZ [Bacteroidota bacterium]